MPTDSPRRQTVADHFPMRAPRLPEAQIRCWNLRGLQIFVRWRELPTVENLPPSLRDRPPSLTPFPDAAGGAQEDTWHATPRRLHLPGTAS